MSAIIPAETLRRVPLLFSLSLFALFIVGCSPVPDRPARPQAKTSDAPPASLEILVVGDPQLAAQVARGWQAEGRGEARVSEQTLKAWQEQEFAIDPKVDVVVFPGQLQNDVLARELLLEVPEAIWNGSEINKAELLAHFRTDLVKYRNKVWTAPLGAPQLTLVYRADVLEALGAAPPQTWTELDALVRRLGEATELKSGDGRDLPRAVAQPLGGDWAANIWLARVAGAISGHGRLSTIVNVETLRPLVDGVPFVEALEAMAAWEKARISGGVAAAYSDPASIYGALVRGEAALGITWPSAQFAASSTEASLQLRVARLPAVAEWYDASASGGGWRSHGEEDQRTVDYLGFGGMVVGVSRNSLHASEAFNFLAWLGSKRTSLQISTQSALTGPFRSSQLANPGRWVGESLSPEAAEQYAEALRQTHADRLVMLFPKLPGQAAYLSALATAAHKAAEGTLSAKEAAAEAATQLNQITESLGGPARQSRLLREAEGY